MKKYYMYNLPCIITYPLLVSIKLKCMHISSGCSVDTNHG